MVVFTLSSYTPLHIAAKEGQEEVAAVLLEHGASLNATTKVSFIDKYIEEYSLKNI